jgi:hypothetical protein
VEGFERKIMIIRPDYLDHIKTRTLRGGLGPQASEYPLRLWAHAEKSSSQQPDLIEDDAKWIAHICQYKGNPEKLKAALIYVPIGCEAGFIEQSQTVGLLRIHGWCKQNARLITSRTNGKHGGRPRNNPQVNPQDNPLVNPDETRPEPMAGSRLDEMRVDEMRSPKPPAGACEWEVSFLAELKNTGKFPALTIEALKQAVRGYPKANLPKLWPEIISEAVSMPGSVIGSPVAWIRASMSRLERQNINLEKKEGATSGPTTKGQLIQIPSEWKD